MKKIVIIALIAVVLLCMAAGVWAFQNNFVIIDGTVYPKVLTYFTMTEDVAKYVAQLQQMPALERLDLRGAALTAQEYEQLQEALPDCRILWEVPFQGETYSADTESLSITTLKPEDIPVLSYLTELKTVDATGCKDYDALVALRQRFPDCRVAYTLELAGEHYDGYTTELTLENAKIQELKDALAYLPDLTSLQLTEPVADAEAFYALVSANPQVAFFWSFDLYGQTFTNLDTEIDLSGIPMESTDAVQTALKYFDGLEKVIMCDCGISNEEMAAMAQANPEIKFVWTVSIGAIRLRTDVSYFMPYQYRKEVDDEDCANLIYCTDLICADLGHMPITTIDFLKNCSQMKYLLIGDTEVTDISACANMPELLYLEMFMCHVDDLSPLLSCKKLEDLNIGAANIGDVTPLCQMTWLKHLWAKRCYVTWAEREQVKAALTDTVVNFKYGKSSTDDGWRELQNYYDMRDLLGMPYFSG